MPSIKKNFIYSCILTSANYIFPLIVYPYVSRVLGADGIGACGFVDSIIKYFVLFSMFGITSIGIREVAKAKKNKENLNKVFNNIFWTNALFTGLSVAVLIAVIFAVPDLESYRKLLFIGVLKVVSNFFLIDWFFRGIEDFRYITIRTLVVKCLYVVSIFIFVRDKSDYDAYYLLTVLMISVNSLFNQAYAHKSISISFKGVNLQTFIYPIAVMGVYTIMTSMYTTFNISYLGFVAGDKEVGYYTTVDTLYGALLALFSAFTGVMLPRMSSLLAEGQFERFKSLLSKSANVLFSFSFPFVFLFVVYAPEIIGLYAGNEFENAVVPMQISMPLMIVIGYEQIIITQGLLPLDKNKAVLINAVLGAITGVVLSLLLVAPFKCIGSVVVWVISEVIVLVSASLFIRYYIKFTFPFKLFISECIGYTPLLLILLEIHKVSLQPIWSIIIAGALTAIYTFIIQRYIFKQTNLVDLTNSLHTIVKKNNKI
jgi:O-antigen/teichoic acid export membrane protein